MHRRPRRDIYKSPEVSTSGRWEISTCRAWSIAGVGVCSSGLAGCGGDSASKKNVDLVRVSESGQLLCYIHSTHHIATYWSERMVVRHAATTAARCVRRAAVRHASSRTTPRPPASPRKSESSPPRSSHEAPTIATSDANAARIARLRVLPLTLAALTAFGIGLYGMQLYVTTTRATTSTDSSAGPQTQAELTEVYDQTAATFDAEVDMSEWLMGIKGWRRTVAESCSGHVLEVSCGTARNLGYYRFGTEGVGVKSLTLADLSLEMVQQGKQKWFALRDKGGLHGVHEGVPVRFWHGDVKGAMPPPPKDEKTAVTPKGYDTIVQSMGLCSTDEPVELLQNLARHLNPQNPEARIVLLEHGRSYYEWWNGVLDSQAATHASKHGCWWNRDVGEIVRRSGLQVVHERRRNFGTTWIFELKPALTPRTDLRMEQQNNEQDPNAGDGWAGWSGWLPRWTYEKICKR